MSSRAVPRDGSSPADEHAGRHARADVALRTERLGVTYRDCRALADVTLAVGRGEITAVVGPSGCGKSSLLMALNRLTDLVPGCRVSGRVKLGELDVHSPATDVVSLRRRVGMIFQKPNPFPLSIRENLALPLRDHGVARRDEIEGMIEGALREVGLWDEVADRLGRSALALSGGQQQRLCIARAVVLDPEILLLDEPCSSLDPIASGVVEDLVERLRGRYTLVMVTHDLAQARRVADQVALLWLQDGAGRLVEHLPAPEFFASPRHPLARAYVTGRRA